MSFVFSEFLVKNVVWETLQVVHLTTIKMMDWKSFHSSGFQFPYQEIKWSKES